MYQTNLWNAEQHGIFYMLIFLIYLGYIYPTNLGTLVFQFNAETLPSFLCRFPQFHMGLPETKVRPFNYTIHNNYPK